MAWPTRPYTLGEGLDRADNEIKAAKSKAASTRATLLAGGLSVEKAHNLLIQVLRIHGTLTTISQIPNIATYANEQLGENVGPAFVAALNATVGAGTYAALDTGPIERGRVDGGPTRQREGGYRQPESGNRIKWIGGIAIWLLASSADPQECVVVGFVKGSGPSQVIDDFMKEANISKIVGCCA